MQLVRIWYASGTRTIILYASCVPRAHERLADGPALSCTEVPWAAGPVQEQVSLAESFKFRRFRTAVLCLLLQGRVQHSLAGEHRLPTRPDALTAAVLQKYPSPGHQWLLFAQERRVSNV